MSDKPQTSRNIMDGSLSGMSRGLSQMKAKKTIQPAGNVPTPEVPATPNNKPNYIDKLNTYLKKRFLTEHEVTGVEIQPDTIRICQAKRYGTEWKILKLASINVLNNYNYENIKKNRKLYSKALEDIFEQNKVANRNIALSIPASMAIIKTVTLPLMTKENLDRATRIPSFWQSLVQISANMAEYSIYYRIVRENSQTKEMDVLFIAARNDDLKIYTEIAKEAGLVPCVIDVGCYSINNLSKLKEDTNTPLQVFMKVGRDENYLQILEEGRPYIYDIFVSDNEKNYLNEFIENQTFQQRFISQLKHIISKHEDTKKVKIEKISVISSESNIDKFITAINPKLEGIAIKTINLMDNIKLPDELINNEEFQKTTSSYAVCVGLATRNLEIFADENKKNVSETINLLPGGADIIFGLRAKFYSKILFWGTLISCCGFIVLFSLFSLGRYSAVRSDTIKFNEQHKIYTEKQSVFNSITAESGVLNKLVRIKESLHPNQQKILSAYSEISAAIPEGVWIEEIRLQEKGRITISGRSFEEQGIISFSKKFDNSEILENVSITSLRSVALENNSMVKEFIISGRIVGEQMAAEKFSGVK